MTPERFARVKNVLSHRQNDLTLVMEGVHKPHNYAAILRSCDAVGVHRAHAVAKASIREKLPKKSPHQDPKLPENEAGLPPESSAGASKWVRVRVHSDIEAAYQQLKGQGVAICASCLHPQAVDYRDIDYTQPTAIVMGTELHGLSEQAIDLADHKIVIPMMGMVQSLNVSVAAAVLLFEAQRQRMKAGLYPAPADTKRAQSDQLFEYLYPEAAERCRWQGRAYPKLDEDGELVPNDEGTLNGMK